MLGSLWFSSFSSGGAGASADYELISTTVLGSSAASVTFSGLGTSAAAYKHLQIRVAATPVAAGVTMWVQFNGDTASNYNHHFLVGQGGIVYSGNGATANGTLIGGIAGWTNSYAMASIMDILDFSNTSKNKTTRALSGQASGEVELCSGLWRSTAAVTSATVYFGGTNIATGSRFSLYGLK